MVTGLGAAGRAVGREPCFKSEVFPGELSPHKQPHRRCPGTTSSSFLSRPGSIPPAFLPGLADPGCAATGTCSSFRALGGGDPSRSTQLSVSLSSWKTLAPETPAALGPRGRSPDGQQGYRGWERLRSTTGPWPGHTQRLPRRHGQIKSTSWQLSSLLDSPTPAHLLEGNKKVKPKCVKNYDGSPK